MSAPGLLIYDGDCGFCTSTAQWYSTRAALGASVAPWQSLNLDEFGLTESQAASQVWYRTSEGEITGGADAAARAMQDAPQPWRTIGLLTALPGVIHGARAIYPLVARNRHRLPGSARECDLDSTR